MTKKVSSAGVIKAVIEALPEGEVVTLEQLVAAVREAGIDKDAAKIFADAASLASRRVIGRGPAPRTFCRLDAAEPRPEAKAAARPRQPRRAAGVFHPAEEVIAGIEAALGPAVERNEDEMAYVAVLLGDWDAAFLLSRAELVLGAKPSRWYRSTVGENVVVGFYR